MSKFNYKNIIVNKDSYYLTLEYNDIINLKSVARKDMEQALIEMYDYDRPHVYRYEKILSKFIGLEYIKNFLNENSYPNMPSYDCYFKQTNNGLAIVDDYCGQWKDTLNDIVIRDHNRIVGSINENKCKDTDVWECILSKHKKGFIKYCDKFCRIGKLLYNIDISSFPETILLYNTTITEYLDDHKFNFNIPIQFKYMIRFNDIKNNIFVNTNNILKSYLEEN